MFRLQAIKKNNPNSGGTKPYYTFKNCMESPNNTSSVQFMVFKYRFKPENTRTNL